MNTIVKYYFHSGELLASAASEPKCYAKRPTTIQSAIIARTKYRYVLRTKSTKQPTTKQHIKQSINSKVNTLTHYHQIEEVFHQTFEIYR